MSTNIVYSSPVLYRQRHGFKRNCLEIRLLNPRGRFKAFVDSTGTKSANFEEKFLFNVFAAFSIFKYLDGEKGHVLLRVLWEIEMSRDRLYN